MGVILSFTGLKLKLSKFGKSPSASYCILAKAHYNGLISIVLVYAGVVE